MKLDKMFEDMMRSINHPELTKLERKAKKEARKQRRSEEVAARPKDGSGDPSVRKPNTARSITKGLILQIAVRAYNMGVTNREDLGSVDDFHEWSNGANEGPNSQLKEMINAVLDGEDTEYGHR